MPPYDIKCIQKGGKWECVTVGSGKVHGRFDSKAQCEAQMRAIYANDPSKKGQ